MKEFKKTKMLIRRVVIPHKKNRAMFTKEKEILESFLWNTFDLISMIKKELKKALMLYVDNFDL